MDSEEVRPTAGETVEVCVPHAFDGMRVDQCLAGRFPAFSRAFFQRCLRTGSVSLNGHACRPADTVKTNDILLIEWPPAAAAVELEGEAIDLDVLAEDDDVLVVNKPPGLVVHPTRHNWTGTLVNALLHRDEERFRDLADEDQRPGIVHRLDKDTSGVMVVAKNESAWTAMKDAFRERCVEKTYLALVLGEFGAVTGRIETRIGRNPRHRLKMAVLEDGGKLAITRYRVLSSGQGVTLVEVHIETGRTHQIRVHFAHLRHPVLGDPLYGGRQRDAAFRPSRQMLHAWRLAFPHPRTGVMREYSAPPPDDFLAALRALGMPDYWQGRA